MIKTAYSFNTAVGQLDEVASRLKEVGWSEGPISDRGNTFGWVKWTKTCQEAGLRPIYGAEIGILDSVAEKRPNIDYWTLLAMDDVAKLNELVSEATSNPGKEPTLTYKRLMRAKGVLKIAHERCLSDKVDWQRNDVFLGLSPATPVGLYRDVISKGGCLVALPRNVYPRESDLEFYRIALGSFRASTQTYAQHIVSDEEWREAVWYADKDFVSMALANRHVLLERCRAELKQAKLLPFPKTKPLKQLCLEGATKLGVCLSEIYKSRLDKELAMIAEKNFEDYFYIIADIVAYAKKEMVVGPARGSSCGSLVCYLLGITSIDPIAHGLLFERFIDITRADLPDIDLDFPHTKRHMVFEYAEEKYGANCSRLGSVGTFQGASSLNQVAQSLLIPKWMSDNVSETLIQRKMGDSRASSTIADTLQDTDAGRALLKNYPEARIVERFEDHPRNASQHAAGLIVTDKPVNTYVAIDGKTRVAMCDKYDAEALNLLKIDILGLIQLSIFERVMELIGVDPASGWLEKIPLDDPAAFDVVNQGKFCGLFQLTGRATRLLCTQIKFDKFDDVVAVNALSRPGPAVSGGMERWVARRAGLEPVSYPHPVFEPVLKDTYGVVCFQEQILQIGREVGDLSWAEVTALRKAMSRSLGEEYFNQFGDKWKQGAVAKGVPQLVADSFWVSMCQYGSWAFNRSHSVAYGYVSYWCMYLKAHHPVEFAAATLDAEKNVVKQIEILRELRDEGVDYIPVDPELSTDRWEIVDGKKLLGPLTNIDGIGPVKVATILSCRKNGERLPGKALQSMLEPPVKTRMDSLYPLKNWLDETYPDGVIKMQDEQGRNWWSPLTAFISLAELQEIELTKGDWNSSESVLVLGTPDHMGTRDVNDPIAVAKRGGKLEGPNWTLSIFFRDDTNQVHCKVGRFEFKKMGRPMQERGKAGKAVYAIRGNLRQFEDGFRSIEVTMVYYLGDMSGMGTLSR